MDLVVVMKRQYHELLSNGYGILHIYYYYYYYQVVVVDIVLLVWSHDWAIALWQASVSIVLEIKWGDLIISTGVDICTTTGICSSYATWQ